MSHRSVTENLRLRFQWPAFPDSSFQEEFFLGAWHPSAELEIDWSPPPDSRPVSFKTGKNWFLLSSRAPFQRPKDSLVHAPSDSARPEGSPAVEAVAFRGYLLEPPIHSWSPPDDILNYWSKEHHRHNGVFAAVRILPMGEIELIGDAFGIAPLYYREFAGGLLFSTNSRFLSLAGDETDRIAARILIQCRSVYGNRSLTQDVWRLPAGTVKRFGADGSRQRRWFDMAGLAEGNRPVTKKGLREVEDAFQTAMDRCLSLAAQGCVLPLSSGHDSRRILAALQSRGAPFRAMTVKVFQEGGLDLDAHFASVMAKELGFNHQVFELPAPAEYARLDRDRRLLVDGHGLEHTWFLSMHRALPQETCLVFDGLGGDRFGKTASGVKAFRLAPEPEKTGILLESVITNHLDGHLSSSYWPSVAMVRQYLGGYLTRLPDGNNRTDLAVLLLRCRSGPGMCSQRLIPAGHVTVYPYFDLEHASITLRFNPLEKLPPDTLQSRCLEYFWPRYFAFPGSNRIPADLQAETLDLTQPLWTACYRQLRSESGFALKGMERLAGKGRIAFALAVIWPSLHQRLRWWLEPFLSVLVREARVEPCWSASPRHTPILKYSGSSETGLLR